MALIHWYGSSDTAPPPATARFWMALDEASALELAATPAPGVRKLALAAAIRCLSRYSLRHVLHATGLNPAWSGIHGLTVPCAVYGPQQAKGVAFLPASAALARLEPHFSRFGVLEEVLPGSQIEIQGWRIGGRVEYVEDPEPRLRQAAEKALQALGLDDAPFTVVLAEDARGRLKVASVRAWLEGQPRAVIEAAARTSQVDA